ncbi:hypothetical protein HPP92_015910 [Vanilla planifolia]|uniref:Uncharacterized protein n=1 Tax=Vanilla planifolia TaxID=51239 RepID=A0A835UU47_VANPL|nr:hypothetical protein HPP92_015910 [Vanilla planifolia]
MAGADKVRKAVRKGEAKKWTTTKGFLHCIAVSFFGSFSCSDGTKGLALLSLKRKP